MVNSILVEQIASRYADGLFDTTRLPSKDKFYFLNYDKKDINNYDKKLQNTVAENLVDLFHLFKEKPKLFFDLTNPTLGNVEKLKLFEQQIVQKFHFHAYTLGFVELLIYKRRLSYFYEIVAKYIELYLAFNRVVRVEFVTRVPIGAMLEKEASEKIKKMLKCDFLLITNTLDQSILAGIKIIICSSRLSIDLTVNNQLQDLINSI